jgi:hypothetical protein
MAPAVRTSQSSLPHSSSGRLLVTVESWLRCQGLIVVRHNQNVSTTFPKNGLTIKLDPQGNANLALAISPEPPPKIDALAIQGGSSLWFLTLTNRHYTVEWINNLLNNNWTELVSGMPGSGTTHMVTDTTTNMPTRFYWLKVNTP